MKKCVGCGIPLPDDTSFCSECGAAQTAPAPQAADAAPAVTHCPQCGAAAEPGAKFCASCGQSIAAAAPPAAQPAMGNAAQSQGARNFAPQGQPPQGGAQSFGAPGQPHRFGAPPESGQPQRFDAQPAGGQPQRFGAPPAGQPQQFNASPAGQPSFGSQNAQGGMGGRPSSNPLPGGANIDANSIKEKLFSFEGRLNRQPAILRFLAVMFATMVVTSIVSGIFYVIAGIAGEVLSSAGTAIEILRALIVFVLYIPAIVINFSLAVRRCHDIGLSGWLTLIFLIPVVGTFFLLFLWIKPGTPGDNPYGPDPLQQRF